MKKSHIFLLIIAISLTFLFLLNRTLKPSLNSSVINNTDMPNLQEDGGGLLTAQPHELSIEFLRQGNYPGSDIVIEENLSDGANYRQYLASYISEGNKIYALLTVPSGQKPASGWPVIIFNHGYIPPAQYRTTERYVAYVQGFARAGYIVFKPDFRGYGSSEGEAVGGYGSNGYTIDVLNALSSIKKLQDPELGPSTGSGRFVDTNRIGMWGHSMGGSVTLKSMVVSKDIKAGVIWAGVVASYPDLINRWRRGPSPSAIPSGSRRWRYSLVEQFGPPEENPEFWNSISANSYLADISGPLQLYHGTADHSVPPEFSERLKTQMEEAGQIVELYTYPGDDHNLSGNFTTAMNRSVAFFDKYVKGGTN